MKNKQAPSHDIFFEMLAARVTRAAGSTAAIVIVFSIVLIWAITGPILHYLQNWQLVINIGTTVITFLMVFLIQKSQNKDSLAIQLKLNELVAAHEFASNRLVDVENMTEEELKTIQKYYTRLKMSTAKGETIRQSHSLDDAGKMHELKKDLEESKLEEIKKFKDKK